MIRSVQYLRGIAALMVLVHHVYRTMLMNRGYLPGWLHDAVSTSFSGGVDIFFVISGFVIYLSIIERPKSPLQFVIDRLARIVPAYWFYSGVFALILIYYPWTHPSSVFETIHFIKSLFFIPSPNPSGMNVFPTLIVGWTLNFEMAFYFVLAVSLLAGTKYLHYSVLILMLAINIVAPKFAATEFYGTTRIYEFVLGVLIARLYLLNNKNFKITTSVSVLVLLLSFYVLLFIHGDTFITNGIPSALIVFSTICLNNKIGNIEFLDKMGESSYSLYLSHKIFICLAIVICKSNGYEFEVMVIPVILFSLAFSFSTYKYIEVNTSKIIKGKISVLKRNGLPS